MITRENHNIYGPFSFLNCPVRKVPNSNFLPKGLSQTVCRIDRLAVLGNDKHQVSGGSIHFNRQDSHISALGELVERYAAGFRSNHKLLFGSYRGLSKENSCFDPKGIKYFKEEQYKRDGFKFKKLAVNKKIHWISSVNFFDKSEILLPYFMVGLENIEKDGLFHVNTTTGTAAHTNFKSAISAGFLENVERDAFCKFWYFQATESHRKFSAAFILSKYPNDDEIHLLFANRKVKITTYDISEYAFCPTFVVFVFFMMDGIVYQSVGASSKLSHTKALKKACLEAYQGVEYVKKCLAEVELPENINGDSDFSFVDSFEKHFVLYNKFPRLRRAVPLLKDASDFNAGFSTRWKAQYAHHIKKFTGEELIKSGIDALYYADLTPIDVRQLGFVVVKIICPRLHLLTGNHNYPYLGLFDDNRKLFTKLPHPFP